MEKKSSKNLLKKLMLSYIFLFDFFPNIFLGIVTILRLKKLNKL